MQKITNTFKAALLALAALTAGCTENVGPNDPAAPSLAVSSNRVSVSPATASVAVGATTQLTATVGGRKGATVVWSSATPGIATVDATTGLVTGVSVGSVLITASYGGSTASSQITVTASPTGGAWVNVTPSNVNLTSTLSCGNYGTETVQADPNRPSDLYAQFHCQGIWKSVDYGKTWVGPINTGSNGATVTDCAGGIRLAPNGTSTPTLYLSCIRGAAIGFWRSLDGGVNWTHYAIAPAPSNRQDVYPPMLDPYDPQHLIMAGHEQDLLVESVNGGQSWTSIPLNPGMLRGSGTGSISFITWMANGCT